MSPLDVREKSLFDEYVKAGMVNGLSADVAVQKAKAAILDRKAFLSEHGGQ